MIIEITSRDIDRLMWCVGLTIQEQSKLNWPTKDQNTVAELEIILDKLKSAMGRIKSTKWNFGVDTSRRNLLFIDGEKDWEDGFIDWYEAFPVDPSSAAQHFQTEEEFTQAYESYRDRREQEAYRAGFAAAKSKFTRSEAP